MPTIRKEQFIYDMRNASTTALDAFGTLTRLGEEYVLVGMAAQLTDADLAPHGVTKQQFTDAVDTWVALLPAITNAQKTKLNRIRN